MTTRPYGALAALLLTGCAATPSVTYHRLSEPNRADTWVLYRLTDTTIVIGAVNERGGGPADGDRPGPPISLSPSEASCEAGLCNPALAAVSAPIDDAGEVIALEPRSRNLVSTSISAAYWPNSLRLKTLSVEVRDHKLEAINTAGAIAVGVGKLSAGGVVRASGPGAPAPAALHLPIVIDMADLKSAKTDNLPDNPGWHIKIKFLDEPIAKSGFIPRASASAVHGAILTSTCRPLQIDIFDLKQAKLSFRVRVADPDWLTPIPLPAIGAVVMAPLCGGDVQGQKIVEVPVDQLAQAFFTQVEAARAKK